MAAAGPYLIAIFLALPVAQLLVWLLARHSTFVEFWRVIPITVTGVLCGRFVLHSITEFGPAHIVGFALAGAFAIWLITGLFYDLEIRHRVIIALSIPIIGTLAMLGGLTFTGALIRQAVGA